MDDVELTFNAESANKFFQQLMKGADAFEKRMQGTATTTTKSNSIMNMSFTGLIGRLGLVSMAIRGVKKLIASMPEIGRTFSIVGDILNRNLVWPLRQEILPLLQRLLDWARENRAGMVRYGTVLVNLFRAVANVVKGVIDILGNLWNKISSSIERTFGITINSMTELANIAIFKLSAVAQYLMIILEPVADFVAKVFDTALVYVKEFVDGFKLGFGEMSAPLTDFLNQISRLGGMLDSLIDKGGTLNKVFKTFGYVVGVVVKGALESVVQVIDTLLTSIESIINRVEYFNAWKRGNSVEMQKLEKEQIARDQAHAERAKQRWKAFGSETVTGAQELGRQLRVEPPAGTTRNTNTTNNYNINVKEAQNAQETAREVEKAVRGTVNMQRIRAGAQ